MDWKARSVFRLHVFRFSSYIRKLDCSLQRTHLILYLLAIPGFPHRLEIIDENSYSISVTSFYKLVLLFLLKSTILLSKIIRTRLLYIVHISITFCDWVFIIQHLSITKYYKYRALRDLSESIYSSSVSFQRIKGNDIIFDITLHLFFVVNW